MGIEAIDPQSIRNVTIIGAPAETAPVVRGMRQTGPAIEWVTDRVGHTIRIAALDGHAPVAELERSIRVADGVIVVANAAEPIAPRLETLLHIADDHQVARLCLITGLDRATADFDRCVAAIAETRGATPLPLQFPVDTGPAFDGVIDLISMRTLAPLAAEFYGRHWQFAEKWYRKLVDAVMNQPGRLDFPAEALRQRIRSLTRIGDVVPVLCAARGGDANAPLLDAIARYLPSPMDVCQPEHALD